MTRIFDQDLNQWLELSKETFECRGYDYEFVGVADSQLNVEVTMPSLGATTTLSDDLKIKLRLYQT